MLDKVIGSLKSAFGKDSVSTDNFVFRLHYKASTVLLVVFSLLVTSKQYFGDPIDCLHQSNLPSQMVDTYCWIHSTFTIPEAYAKELGVEVPHPGVDNYKEEYGKMYHTYYQWVSLVLLIQGMAFYAPKYLWKRYENGRIQKIRNLYVEDMKLQRRREREDSLSEGDEEKTGSEKKEEKKKDEKEKICELYNEQLAENLEGVVTYLTINRDFNNCYFYYYVMCEIFNFVNVLCQMFIVDSFLGGKFASYGLEFMQRSGTDKNGDVTDKVFPKMTKCVFHMYGRSGQLELHDLLCIIPLNIVNEKIYIFLWFWFVGLCIVSFWAIVYRFVLIAYPWLRCRIFYLRFVRRANKIEMLHVLDTCKVGDWFILNLLSKNMEEHTFCHLISCLAEIDTISIENHNSI